MLSLQRQLAPLKRVRLATEVSAKTCMYTQTKAKIVQELIRRMFVGGNAGCRASTKLLVFVT